MLCFFNDSCVGSVEKYRPVKAAGAEVGAQKIARRCGEKHICKSKCTKHDGFGALLSVQMSKNCLALWRKAHLKVKMYKT